MTYSPTGLPDYEEKLLSDEQRLLGQKAALRANLFTGIISQIVLGALMMLYASDVLGYSPVRIGFIVSVAPIGMLTRFFMLRSVHKTGKTRALRRSAAARMLIIAFLMAIPAGCMTFTLFTMLLCAFTLANELGTTIAWQPILRDITTTGDRGSFFSRMRFAFTVVTALVTFTIPFLIGASIREWQYKLLLAVAMAGTATFYYWAGKIPEEPSPTPTNEPLPPLWAHLKGIIRSSPLLREPLTVTILASFMAFPVFVLYLKEMLHIPSNLISMYVFAGTAGAAISYLLWGRVADTVGFRPMYIGLLILTLAIQPLIVLMTPFPVPWNGVWGSHEIAAMTCLLLQGLLNGALTAGTGIALITIQHFCVHRRDVVASMTIYNAVIILVMAAVSMITSVFLQTVAQPSGSRLLASGWVSMDGVKIWIILTNVVFAVLILRLLRRIPNSHANMEVSDFFDSVTATLSQALKGARFDISGK